MALRPPLSPGSGFEKGGIGLAPQLSSDFCFLPKSAMTVIGFSEEEMRRVLEVTALVLKLGNVELSNEFQANGIPASGICDTRGLQPPAEVPAQLPEHPALLPPSRASLTSL